MTLELLQWITSHRKNYPRGVPILGEHAVFPVQGEIHVLFLTEQRLTTEEEMLIRNAAEKGLKLNAKQYTIGSEAISNATATVVLGKTQKKIQNSQVIHSYTAAEILSSADAKRSFWEAIRVLAPV